MSGIPEIIGESHDSTRSWTSRHREVGYSQSTSVCACIARTVRDHGGMTVSPLRLRLIDFAGEGERAPPGVRRRGQAEISRNEE